MPCRTASALYSSRFSGKAIHLLVEHGPVIAFTQSTLHQLLEQPGEMLQLERSRPGDLPAWESGSIQIDQEQLGAFGNCLMNQQAQKHRFSRAGLPGHQQVTEFRPGQVDDITRHN